MSDYKYLQAWNHMMGSFPYFCEDSLREARHDKAPQDAIYKDDKGRWHTFADITDDQTRKQIERLVSKIS